MGEYPVTFSVEYPDRDLDRLTSFFRLPMAVPILIVISMLRGLLFPVNLLMIVFRQKYPRWWFDFNLQLIRFGARVGVYLALMDDQYPSTDEEQSVRLNFPCPDAQRDLNRWLPLVKWLLAIPHYVVLWLLGIGAVAAAIIAWFVILFTGRYPRGLFGYIEGVMRWYVRVAGYAFVLVADEYPPFRLAA